MTEYDEFKRLAIETAKAEDFKREQDAELRNVQEDEEAFAQLKTTLPLLTRCESHFGLCGYQFSRRVTGWDSQGRLTYSLQSGLSDVTVYDEASFGRFLNDIEYQRTKSFRAPKGFWASLFS